jgi:hypothetical protein
MADKNEAKNPGKRNKMRLEVSNGEEGGAAEPHRAIIAVHPSAKVIAIAVGDELRVFDMRQVFFIDSDFTTMHLYSGCLPLHPRGHPAQWTASSQAHCSAVQE